MKSLNRTSRFQGSVKSSWTIGKVLKPLDSLIKNCQLITTFLYVFHFFYGSLNTIKLYNKLHKILFIWGIILVSLVVRSLRCAVRSDQHVQNTPRRWSPALSFEILFMYANRYEIFSGWVTIRPLKFIENIFHYI